MTMAPTVTSAFTSAPSPTMSTSSVKISPVNFPSTRTVPSNDSFPSNSLPLPSNVVTGWALPSSPDVGGCVVNVMAYGREPYTSTAPAVNGDGNPEKVRSALGTLHTPCHPLAALGLAKPSAPYPPPTNPLASLGLARSGYDGQSPPSPTRNSAQKSQYPATAPPERGSAAASSPRLVRTMALALPMSGRTCVR